MLPDGVLQVVGLCEAVYPTGSEIKDNLAAIADVSLCRLWLGASIIFTF